MRYWILAIIITLSAAVYQRMTGPSYPMRGDVELGGTVYKYRLTRSHTTDKDAPVKLSIPDQQVTATVLYRRFKTDINFHALQMNRDGDNLVALLPRQPAAGKLEYKITLLRGKEQKSIPLHDPVVIRFKDPVPSWVLIPHIIFMFFGMLVSNRAGIECLRKNANPMKLAWWTFGLLFMGGLVLGPIVQWYAFGDAWTGVPFGIDLTDNKTLIAVVFWVLALILGRTSEKQAKIWVFTAAVVTVVIFSIPHSLLGSELDYKTGKVIQG